MSDKENSASKKSRFRMARGWVAFACVAFALAGMAFRVGIGTPAAFGIQQISAICPLGALETMAGAKGVMLHPLLLFALVVVLIALVGKAFCAWVCPVPWLQKFFRPRKHSAAKGGVGRDAPTKGGAGHGVPASRNDSGATSAQVEPSAAGAAQIVEFRGRTGRLRALRVCGLRGRIGVCEGARAGWWASATACGWTAATRCWWERWPPRLCSVSRCFASSARSV